MQNPYYKLTYCLTLIYFYYFSYYSIIDIHQATILGIINAFNSTQILHKNQHFKIFNLNFTNILLHKCYFPYYYKINFYYITTERTHTMKIFFIFILSLIYSLPSFAEKVAYVYDGDTFTTVDGKKVRLLNINSPELAKKLSQPEPFAQQAKKELNKLIANKDVELVFDKEKHDKYGRLLAYVYLNDGTFVNKKLLDSGLVHLYTFPNNISKAEELRKAENIARSKNIGLWSHPRWKVKDANNYKKPKKSIYGKYQMYQGKVKECKTIKDKTYLNFGSNWRTDFSVEINEKYYKYFKNQHINPKKDYCNKNVLVRGILIPVNGSLISATHPSQIEILSK